MNTAEHTPADKIRAGLLACGRAGIGLDAAVQALVGQLDPPDDPQHFSAALACNILGVRP